MFGTIVIPLDVDESMEHALPLAVALARRMGDRALLLSVVPGLDELSGLAEDHESDLLRLQAQRQSEAEKHLGKVRARTVPAEVEAATSVQVGAVAETILDAAREKRAGLIAIATHGRVGPERWFLGSVADRVVRTSPIPVLLVRPGEAGGAPSAVPTDILVPLDGSTAAEAALPLASELATALGASITLIRTIPTGWWTAGSGMYASGMSTGTPDLITAVENDARAYLEATAVNLRTTGVEVRTSLALFRAPDLQVEEEAAGCMAPLVVMTSHGRSGVRRTLLGSVTDRIVRSATTPVVVVPDGDDA